MSQYLPNLPAIGLFCVSFSLKHNHSCREHSNPDTIPYVIDVLVLLFHSICFVLHDWVSATVSVSDCVYVWTEKNLLGPDWFVIRFRVFHFHFVTIWFFSVFFFWYAITREIHSFWVDDRFVCFFFGIFVRFSNTRVHKGNALNATKPYVRKEKS